MKIFSFKLNRTNFVVKTTKFLMTKPAFLEYLTVKIDYIFSSCFIKPDVLINKLLFQDRKFFSVKIKTLEFWLDKEPEPPKN